MNRYYIGLIILGVGLVILLITDSSGSVFGLDNNDFGRLVYGGALIAVLAVWFLSARRNMSGGLRAAAIWLSLALVLVAGYQYRYELQDIASRITAGLIPGSPLSSFDQEGRATVMMEKRQNGHFEVRGTVEGADVEFLVDTGATSTVLTAEDASRAGIDVSSLNYSIPVSTANGTTTAAATRAREITVGSIIRRNQPILVAAEGSLGQSLLGMNFISTLSGFDMRGDRLTLRD